jgi:hypothetical protein
VRAVLHEIHAHHQVFVVFVGVLDAVQYQESDAQQRRDREQQSDHAARIERNQVDREGDGGAAQQKDSGLDRAEQDLGVLAAKQESLRVADATHRVAREEYAEEQYFGREEHPHPELRGRVLLFRIVELLGHKSARAKVLFANAGGAAVHAVAPVAGSPPGAGSS